MSEPKFTKGPLMPFEIESSKFQHNYVDYGIEDKSKTVLCWTTSGPKETRKANVNLWAAAPEMYWMLEKCRTALHNCGMSCLSEDVFLLLKKARGEE